MTRQTLQRLALLWLVVAAAAIPVRMRDVAADPVKAGALRVHSSFAQSSRDNSTANLVDAAVSANLFGVPGTHERLAGAQGIDVSASGGAISPPARRLRVSAIIGPPWRAVIETEGDQVPPIVLEAGDSLQAYRVVRIVADSIVLQKNRETFRRLVSESWIP